MKNRETRDTRVDSVEAAFRNVRISDLPLRTLREVSAMVAEVGSVGGDYRSAMDVVIHSPRTPFLGVFLIAIAIVLIVVEGFDAPVQGANIMYPMGRP